MQAAEDFVRVIVRRPHAYFFLDEYFGDEGGIASATPSGCKLGDGTLAPLPGIYLLDGSGAVLARVAVAGRGARTALLEAMAEASTP